MKSSVRHENRRRMFEQFIDLLNESGRIGAIYKAMVERRRQIHPISGHHSGLCDHGHHSSLRLEAG